MKFTEARSEFVARLRKGPRGAAPRMRLETLAEFHAWKAEMRAFDAAQIDLGIATAEEVQARNAAVRASQGARVVRHARYV